MEKYFALKFTHTSRYMINHTSLPHPSDLHCSGLVGLLGRILGLYSRELELFTHTLFHGIPPADDSVHVPRKQANPRLYVVVKLERHVIDIGNLAGRMGDLVFRPLVFELEKTPDKQR